MDPLIGSAAEIADRAERELDALVEISSPSGNTMTTSGADPNGSAA